MEKFTAILVAYSSFYVGYTTVETFHATSLQSFGYSDVVYQFEKHCKAGKFQLWTSRDLVWYSEKQSMRVRVVKLTDGYYCYFLIDRTYV